MTITSEPLSRDLSLASEDELVRYRTEFPQLKEQIYFNNCSVGARSKRVVEATERYLDSWQRFGGRSWYGSGGWLDTLEGVRVKISQLLGARPHEIALAPNASTGLAAIASALPFNGRNKVVVTRLDFPTLVYQWLSKSRLGIQACVIGDPSTYEIGCEMFERSVDAFDPRSDALKFELGTPAICPLYAANAGLDMIREIGPARIRRRMQYLISDLVAGLRAVRLSPWVHRDPNQQSAIVRIPREEPENVVIELLKQNIVVDSRPGCVRVAPYFYNTTEENAEFCRQAAGIIDQRQKQSLSQYSTACAPAVDTD